jgi:organic radical activating enzyme
MEKRYCAAPWRSLHINFFGQIKTCCAGNPSMLGSLETNTIEQALASEKLIEIKQSILNGELHPEYCYNCIQAEKYGTSEREWHNSLNEDFEMFATDINDHLPVLVDVRWNTTCNLSCNYCSEFCSSRWAKIKKASPPDTSIKSYYKNVVDYIQTHIESVKEIALVGGEPLLLKENLPLLDILPDNILVTVITNLSLDIDINRIGQKLLQRQKTGWSVSFDNIGDKFEYVRYGADWNVLDNNLSKVCYAITNKQHHGGIHSVYNLYNCTQLCELKDYALEKGISIHWQTLHHPDMFDPSKHSKDVIRLALDEATKYLNSYQLEKHEKNYIETLVNVLSGQLSLPENLLEKSKNRHEFLEYTDLIENQYHPGCKKFNKLWPELAEVI